MERRRAPSRRPRAPSRPPACAFPRALQVMERLAAIPRVLDVHDFHVWTLAGGLNNMWAHLTVEPGADSTVVLNAAQEIAKSVDCAHCCFQVEDSGTYDRVKSEGDHYDHEGCLQTVTTPANTPRHH